MMSNRTITRQALGHVYPIGAYYDARRDHFLIGSFLNSVSSSDVIGRDPAVSTIYEHGFSDTLEEKTRKFQLDSSLKVSLLAGLVEPKGSGGYLTHNKETNQTVQASVIYRQTTVQEKLKLDDSRVAEYLAFDHQPGDTTHVVVGITYGYCVCANFERRVTKKEDAVDIQTQLQAAMGEVRLISSASGSVHRTVNQTTNTIVNLFDIKIYADFDLEDDLPQNVQEAMTFFRQLPQYTRRVQAKPVEYILYPISDIKRRFNVTSSIESLTVTDMTEATVSRIQHNAERILHTKQQYNGYYQTYQRVKACISKQLQRQIEDKKLAINSIDKAYHQRLVEFVLAVRSGMSSEDHFLQDISDDQLVRTYEESYISKDKINFLNLATDRGCHLVNENATLDLIPHEHGQNGRHLFLFYISDHLIRNQPDTWKIFIQKLFQNIDRYAQEALYFIIDYDLHPEAITSLPSNFLLKHYRGSSLVLDDNDVSISNGTENMYCRTCGAEDNEERFVSFNIPPNNGYMFADMAFLPEATTEFGKVLLFRRDSYLTVARTRLSYSTGVHEIQFKVLDFDNPLQFGVSLHKIPNTLTETPRTAIEVTFGAPFFTDSSICQKNDIYQLTIDCCERSVKLFNMRTNWQQTVEVNLVKYPFTWQCIFKPGISFLRSPWAMLRIMQVTHR